MLRFIQSKLEPLGLPYHYYFNVDDVVYMEESINKYTNGHNELVLIVNLRNGTRLELSDNRRTVGPEIARHKDLGTSNYDD